MSIAQKVTLAETAADNTYVVKTDDAGNSSHVLEVQAESQFDTVESTVIQRKSGGTTIVAGSTSTEVLYEINGDDVQGSIQQVYLDLQLTASAAMVGFWAGAITDLQFKMGQVKTEIWDWRMLLIDNSIHYTDSEMEGVAAGYNCFSNVYAGQQISTTAEYVRIDITGPIRALKLNPSALVHPISITFKFNNLATIADQATSQTMTINAQEVRIYYDTATNADDHTAYKKNVSLRYVQPDTLTSITLTSGAVTDSRLEVQGLSPFILAMAVDASADLGTAAMDWSALSTYRLKQKAGAGNLLSGDNSDLLVRDYYHEVLEQFPGSVWSRKNVLYLPLGSTNALAVFNDGCLCGALRLSGNEVISFTSSDANADELRLYPMFYHALEINNGRVVSSGKI